MNKKINKNPLALEDKNYTIEEFASLVRNKFGVNDNLPDEILVSAFIEKYPMYSCKIKIDSNKGGCSCC
tara:strand:+ start:1417 stop:1623 length:207 start_codon:yes stop_codon:yes gene_type:complete